MAADQQQLLRQLNNDIVINLHKKGDFLSAVRNASLVLINDPTAYTVWHNRGLCHKSMGNTKEALFDFAQAAFLNSWYAFGSSYNSLLESTNGKYDLSIKDQILEFESKYTQEDEDPFLLLNYNAYLSRYTPEVIFEDLKKIAKEQLRPLLEQCLNAKHPLGKRFSQDANTLARVHGYFIFECRERSISNRFFQSKLVDIDEPFNAVCDDEVFGL